MKITERTQLSRVIHTHQNAYRPGKRTQLAVRRTRFRAVDQPWENKNRFPAFPYFVQCKLYPNVDFYSGIIYQAMGFTPDMFTVLFGIPRVAGWLAQWSEMLEDPEQKIARPRQVYTGEDVAAYPVHQMENAGAIR